MGGGIKVDAIDSTTEEGRERLKKIIATLLNSYLAQLLEYGFLHADPHPASPQSLPYYRVAFDRPGDL